MLLLTATTDLIRIITSAACDVDVVANYVERNQSTFVVGADGRQATNITTATTTTVVGSPGATTSRNVKTVHIRNAHASTSVDVMVTLELTGPVVYELHKVTLLAGEALEYVEGVGFFVLANASGLDRKLIVAADVTNATTAFADVTGLTCPLLSGKHYNFQAMLIHRTDATTTGARFGVNIGAVPTQLAVHGESQITSSVTAAAQGQSAMVTARDTAIVVETTGPGAVNMLCMMYGWIQPSADGIFAIRCQSEVAVANALIVEAGSWCRIWEATG